MQTIIEGKNGRESLTLTLDLATAYRLREETGIDLLNPEQCAEHVTNLLNFGRLLFHASNAKAIGLTFDQVLAQLQERPAEIVDLFLAEATVFFEAIGQRSIASVCQTQIDLQRESEKDLPTAEKQTQAVTGLGQSLRKRRDQTLEEMAAGKLPTRGETSERLQRPPASIGEAPV